MQRRPIVRQQLEARPAGAQRVLHRLGGMAVCRAAREVVGELGQVLVQGAGCRVLDRLRDLAVQP